MYNELLNASPITESLLKLVVSRIYPLHLHIPLQLCLPLPSQVDDMIPQLQQIGQPVRDWTFKNAKSEMKNAVMSHILETK